MVGKYKVITLCGSTRFKDQFFEVQKRLTLDGNIVISVGLFGHSGDDEVWTEGTKEMLDDMHKRKIDMADEIYVINVGGYIGSSTRSEIEYAKQTNKKVRYLEENLNPNFPMPRYLYYRPGNNGKNPFDKYDDGREDEETKRKSWIWHAERMFDDGFMRDYDEERIKEIADWRIHNENVLRGIQRYDLADALESFPTVQQALVSYSIELHCKWMIYEDYPYWIVEEYMKKI